MARTALTLQQITRAGLKPTFGAANGSGGHSFANDGRVFHEVINGSGAPITTTFQTPGLVDGLAIADLVVTIPAGETWMIGPFPPGIYNQADNTVYVDYSAVTTVTVAAIRK